MPYTRVFCMEGIMPHSEGRKLAQLFGSIVAEKRRQLHLSQEMLAEKLGISQESLSRMEKGVIAPRFDRLQIFAQVLHCSVAELFQEQTTVTGRAGAIEKILAPLPENMQKELMVIIANIADMIGSQK